jgi:hypothetical protein
MVIAQRGLALQLVITIASGIDENELLTHLRSRVRGQDRILQDLAKFIRSV